MSTATCGMRHGACFCLLLLAVGALVVLPVSAGAQQVKTAITIPGSPGPSDYAMPQNVVIDPDANRVYTSGGYEGQPPSGFLAIIDATTDTLLKVIPAPGAWPWGMAFDSVSKKLFLGAQGGGGTWMFDPMTESWERLASPWAATQLAINPVTRKL